jgi:hypothetical protein
MFINIPHYIPNKWIVLKTYEVDGLHYNYETEIM